MINITFPVLTFITFDFEKIKLNTKVTSVDAKQNYATKSSVHSTIMLYCSS